MISAPVSIDTVGEHVATTLAHVQARARVGGMLWFAGNPALLAGDAWRLSVAGTRQSDAWSLAFIEATVNDAVEHGALVVSGGALGTDTHAHRAALLAGGRTVVILPVPITDIDLDRWRSQVTWDLDRTLFLSHLAPGTRFERGHPVVRNRLIAALAEAALVGRTHRTSGTNHFLAATLRFGVPTWMLRHDVANAEMRDDLIRLERRGIRLIDRDTAAPSGLGIVMQRAALAFRRTLGEDDPQLRLCEDPP